MKRSSKPHVILVGAQKSGTTWLHNTLEYNSEFWCPSDGQEVHFFDRFYDRGYKKYEQKYARADVRHITFDVTPDYMCHPLVPRRIYKYKKVSKRPVKLIAMLRDPIERAISAYKMKVRKGGYDLRLSEALSVDTSLVSKSKYAKSLKRYQRLFAKKDIKILIMEKVFNDTDRCLQELEDYVGSEFKINNFYKYVKVNASSRRGSHRVVQIASRILRYLGGEKVVHRVKRTNWSTLLRKDSDEGYDPIVDKEGIDVLKTEVADEVGAVARMTDHKNVDSLWNTG